MIFYYSLLYTALFILNIAITSDLNNTCHLSDSLYHEGLYKKSFLQIKKIYKENNNNADVVFRMARSVFLKAMEEKNKNKQIKYYYEGFEYAKKGLSLDSQNGYVIFWYAAYLGRIGELEGPRQAILNSYEVKKYGMKAIQLVSEFDSPYHMMGRWHYELANLNQLERLIASIVYETLPKGSYNEAISLFKRAIEIKPSDIRHHFWLGKTYYAMGELDLSKKEFKMVLSLKAKDQEDSMMQSQSEEYL